MATQSEPPSTAPRDIPPQHSHKPDVGLASFTIQIDDLDKPATSRPVPRTNCGGLTPSTYAAIQAATSLENFSIRASEDILEDRFGTAARGSVLVMMLLGAVAFLMAIAVRRYGDDKSRIAGMWTLIAVGVVLVLCAAAIGILSKRHIVTFYKVGPMAGQVAIQSSRFLTPCAGDTSVILGSKKQLTVACSESTGDARDAFRSSYDVVLFPSREGPQVVALKAVSKDTAEVVRAGFVSYLAS